MEREIFSRLTGLPYVWNCNAAYFVLWSYRPKNFLGSTLLKHSGLHSKYHQLSVTSYTFQLISYDGKSSVRIHLRQSCSAREKKHNVTWPIWTLQMVTWASPKFNLHFFSHNYHNYSMFRYVPGCSGMFRDVPCSWFYPLALNWREDENLVVENIDNEVFMSRNYRSDSCPLMFLKLAYLF